MFLALVHFRYEFQDEGNYAAFGLSMLPLPESGYLQKVEQSPMLENGHEGAGAAGAASAAGAATSSACSGAATAMATATKLCDASLPIPGSSARSSVTSTTSSLSAVGGPAASSGGVGRRGSGSGGEFGGGGGGDFQPLPPLDVMHQHLGSLPSQGRVDAWGSHDVGGAGSSAGDTGRGLEDSVNSSKGSVNGGGGDGFQDGIGGGGLELDSGRGGLSSGGWMRASGRGEMRVADGGI